MKILLTIDRNCNNSFWFSKVIDDKVYECDGYYDFASIKDLSFDDIKWAIEDTNLNDYINDDEYIDIFITKEDIPILDINYPELFI